MDLGSVGGRSRAGFTFLVTQPHRLPSVSWGPPTGAWGGNIPGLEAPGTVEWRPDGALPPSGWLIGVTSSLISRLREGVSQPLPHPWLREGKAHQAPNPLPKARRTEEFGSLGTVSKDETQAEAGRWPGLRRLPSGERAALWRVTRVRVGSP